MIEITHLLNSSIGLLLALLMGVFGGMIPILKDWAETNWKKRFREQLGKAISMYWSTYFGHFDRLL
jgi:UDP-N-acetylmuramyl pentapeptide phosphotransferase/UDP-N-acetylglucosamine-1-phosphate transferase